MTTSNFKHRNTAYTFLLFAPALLLVFIVLAVSWAPEFRLEYLPWTCIGSIAGISSAWFLVSLKRLMDCRTVAADMKDAEWIVCQIGAREHYTVPCALHKVGRLELLVTDIWQKFDTRIGRFFAKGRMFQRWHPALADAQVWAPNSASLIFEGILRRLRRVDAPASTIRRNNRFQRQAVALLEDYERSAPGKHRVLFAFSYGAAELFKFAKSRGWTTVLGQIDPGPYEEQLVAAEHDAYPASGSTWKPAPDAYWTSWREEVRLADHIIVNSEWACHGLISAGVLGESIHIIPLVCDPENKPLPKVGSPDGKTVGMMEEEKNSGMLEVLFLGNVCLRKGIARLVDAMRLLTNEPVHLTICGPLSVNPSLWSGLPSVTWVDSVANSTIRSCYQSADVFILPTISDGFARTQLESLAAGTPVIASRNCGHVVIDGVNGFILEENTPEEIAGMLRRLAADRSLLAKCVTQVLPDGWPRTLTDLAEELVKIVSGRIPGNPAERGRSLTSLRTDARVDLADADPPHAVLPLTGDKLPSANQ